MTLKNRVAPAMKRIQVESDDEDDVPLIRPVAKRIQVESDDEDDVPLVRPAVKRIQVESDDEDDVPLIRPAVKRIQVESDEEDGVPLVRPAVKNETPQDPTPQSEPGTPNIIPIKIVNGKSFIKGTRVVVDMVNCIVVGIVYHSVFIRALLSEDREVCRKYSIPYLGDLLQECGIMA